MTSLTKTNRNRQLPGLFDDFFRDGFFPASFFEGFPAGTVVPDANIIENGNNYQVELAAPGLDRKDFKVEVKDGILTVSAEKEEEKKEEGKNFRRREFFYNSFTRSFALPENLLTEKIDAKYDDGILRLTLPKKQVSPAEPAKQIKVS